MISLSQLRPALVSAIVFVLAFDLAFCWQRGGGAYTSEFGGHPDEAAHYVTGLMVHDYLGAHCPGSPMKYAEAYYAHYPKIGLGIWPPVFYAVQAAWTLSFGISRLSVLLLMCALAATAALLVHIALRRELGVLISALGALLFVSLPLVRDYYGMVMAEMLSTIFMFGATLIFGRFLDEGKARDAWFFGLLAALAILTKGTGVALGLMVPLAFLFTRKWQLLKHPALWGGAVLTALVAGPWTWKFRSLGKGGWEQPLPSFSWTREALPFFAGKFGMALGVVLMVLFCVGVLTKARGHRRAKPAAPEEAPPDGASENAGFWAASGALIVAVIVFQSIVPAGKEARHLIPALPAAVAFAMAGFVRCLHGWQARFRRGTEPSELRDYSRQLSPPLILGGIFLFASIVLPLSSNRNSGFARLAEDVLREAGPNDVMLVSSDAIGEGMFIAAVAQRDPKRPGYTVKRASKELASSEWSGRGYRQKYESDDDLLGFLLAGKIRYLVADDSLPEARREAHHDTLKRVLEVDSGHFWQLATAEITRNGEPQTTPARLFRIETKAAGESAKQKTK